MLDESHKVVKIAYFDQAMVKKMAYIDYVGSIESKYS